jgi:hypothetical protein
MTNIKEIFYLPCPYVRAREYLHDALEEAAQNRLPQLLRLSTDVLPGKVEIAKNVLVDYDHSTDPMHFDEPWRIHWTPEPGGVYPAFEGEVTVRADEDFRAAILELRGEYQPPLGAAGELFDLTVGKTIARKTARRLLERIGAEMKKRYDQEEAAKPQAVKTHATGA